MSDARQAVAVQTTGRTDALLPLCPAALVAEVSRFDAAVLYPCDNTVSHFVGDSITACSTLRCLVLVDIFVVI